jgi:hypothetical protein
VVLLAGCAATGDGTPLLATHEGLIAVGDDGRPRSVRSST